MKVVQEITVFLENHPGTLAAVTKALGERKINIHGFDLSNALDHGALRLVVDDPTAAVHLFGEHNMFALENEVLSLRLRNEAGALTRLAKALGDGDVNVEYAYGTAEAGDSRTTAMIVRVSNNEKALEVLRGVDGVE